LGLALAAVTARVPPLLVWTAVVLSGEELAALALRAHPGDGWALSFAVLLFAGLELSYVASSRAIVRHLLDDLPRRLWPSALAIVATMIVAAVPHPALAGVALIALGLGAAAVLIIVVALLAMRADGASGQR
jgi:hypothetical protein